MSFNLPFLSSQPVRQLGIATAVAAGAARLLAMDLPSMPVAPSEAPGPRPAVDPAWQSKARKALDLWMAATTAPARLSALDVMAPLVDAHPLILAPLKPALDNAEPDVRTRLLQMFSLADPEEAVRAARIAVRDPDSTLAAAAAHVLGQLKPEGVLETLLAVWDGPVPPAAPVGEAVTAALATAVPPDDLESLRKHPRPEVQRAALFALSHQRSAHAAAFLALPDVAEDAALVIYNHRLEGAWAALISAGTRPDSLLGEEGRQRAFAAAWLAGWAEAAEAVATWLAAQPEPPPSTPLSPSTQLAWRVLIEWDAPPSAAPFAPHRPLAPRPRPAAEAWNALQKHTPALEAWAARLGHEALTAWKSWKARRDEAPQSTAEFAAFVQDSHRPEGERVFHFQTRLAAPRDATAVAEAARIALTVPDAPHLRAMARSWLFRQHGPGAVPWLLQSLAEATAWEKQAAIRLLDHHRSPEAEAYLLRLLDQARLGLVDPAVLPEVVEAVERRARAEGPESRGLRAALDAWRASQPPTLGDPLRPWRSALQPGDADAGRRLYYSELARCASCHESPGTGSPSLEGVASRLDGPGLLEAVVLPADPAAQPPGNERPDGGCRPVGTLLTLRELRDLLTYLRSLP